MLLSSSQVVRWGHVVPQGTASSARVVSSRDPGNKQTAARVWSCCAWLDESNYTKLLDVMSSAVRRRSKEPNHRFLNLNALLCKRLVC